MAATITAAQMRDLEKAAIRAGDVTGLELMERAGSGVVAEILSRWPGPGSGNGCALVLCGPGNNGGDGFVVARLLAKRGWEVEAVLLGDPMRLPPDARTNYDRWATKNDVGVYEAATLRAVLKRVTVAEARHWLVVDALFGIGQRAPLDAALEPFNALLHEISARGHIPETFCVAIDVPTGLDADSGEKLAKKPFRADLIVTFHAKKPVHEAASIGDAAVAVADIGL